MMNIWSGSTCRKRNKPQNLIWFLNFWGYSKNFSLWMNEHYKNSILSVLTHDHVQMYDWDPLNFWHKTRPSQWYTPKWFNNCKNTDPPRRLFGSKANEHELTLCHTPEFVPWIWSVDRFTLQTYWNRLAFLVTFFRRRETCLVFV